MAPFKFTVDSALLNELGEKLVESVHIALVELVKNAYDADATKVVLRFIESSSGGPEIQIVDDGQGMTLEEVHSYWMRIATTNKVEREFSRRYGRPRTGSKGIGRFACRRLGTKLQLTTSARRKQAVNGRWYEETSVYFPWKDFEAGTTITEIVCEGNHKWLAEKRTGTTLVISGAQKNEWTRQGYDYLNRQLALLTANRGMRRKGFDEDPGFDIVLEAPGVEGEVKDLRDEFLSAGWGTLEGNIGTDHRLHCTLDAKDVGKKDHVCETKFSHLSGISFQIGIFPVTKDQWRNRKLLSKTGLRTILPKWGGVQVKFRGFRVYPYGEDDWLNIDRDRGRRLTAIENNRLKLIATRLDGVDPGRALLSMLSMRQYVGTVDIGDNSQGFELKLNREGFLEGEAFRELKESVRYAINWSTIYRDYYIRQSKKEEADLAAEYLQQSLGVDIPTSEVVPRAIESIKKEVAAISDRLPSAERREFSRAIQTATNAIAHHSESNRHELVHLRLIASTSTLLLVFSHEVKYLLGLLEGHSINVDLISRHADSKVMKPLLRLKEGMVESKERFEELLNLTSAIIQAPVSEIGVAPLLLRERVRKAADAFRLICDAYSIRIDDKGIPEQFTVKGLLEAELYAILLNALSNSIKSVIAAGGKKEIKLSARTEKGGAFLDVLDSGIGLRKKYFEDAFVPFIADPEHRLYKHLKERLDPADRYIVGTGSGLGLSIVREMLVARGGAIRFKKPTAGWKAHLEVSFP